MARKSKKALGVPGSGDTPPVQADGVASEQTAEPLERGKSPADELLIGMAEQAVTTAAAAAGEVGPVDVFATQWTELDLRCRDCQIIHYVPICLFLNAAESPQLVQRIIAQQFNTKRCPVCHQIEYVEYPYAYYDPARKLVVQVRPEWEWHAGGGEEWYAARLEDLFERWSAHDVRIEVVFGPQPLIERFLQEVPSPPARR